MNKIIVVVGMCGSGKSVVCDYLLELGYKKVYFGKVTMDKLKEANLEVTPENEKMMREKIRKEYGMGAFATLLIPEITDLSKNNNVVLDGVYSWSELKILKEKFANMYILSVIVNKNIRYERLSKREVRPFTKEEAIKRDISEIENIEKGGPIAYADYFILNNGTKEELHEELDIILERINNE